MSYENKEYILQFFEGVHEKESKDELLEAYRKAKAFDELYKQVKGIEKELFGTGKPIVPQKDAFARLGIVLSDFIYDEYESGEQDA